MTFQYITIVCIRKLDMSQSSIFKLCKSFKNAFMKQLIDFKVFIDVKVVMHLTLYSSLEMFPKFVCYVQVNRYM